MADVDFNINIRTIADTTGIKLTQQGLDALKVAALQGNQQAITSLQQLTAAQKQVAGVGAGNASELGRLIGQFTGVGLAGSILAFVNGLKQASAEIEKVAIELDKQGEMLVRHAQLYGEAARHAKDVDDVLKISSATLKDIESTQKTFTDLSQKELGYAASISDYLQKQLLARQRLAGLGDYEAARQAELETAASQAQAARQRGMQEVLAAEKSLNQTTEEHLATLNREIAAEEKRKATAAANTDPGGYVKAANNLSILEKEFQEFIKLEEQERQAKEKQQEAAYGAASPQAKSIIANEKAAREAKARGDEKSAEQFQKSADQLRASASGSDLAGVQAVSDTYGKASRPGRASGVGESQDLVDEQERQRLAAENAQKPTSQSSGETGTGGPSMTGQAALEKRLDDLIELQRQQIGIWR